MSSFTSVTSTRSPWRTRSSGPGTVPSKVSASTARPEGSRIDAARAVRVKRASGGPDGPVRSATLTVPLGATLPCPGCETGVPPPTSTVP